MEVIKTWIVNHKNGRTQMYLLESGNYVIVVPTPTGQCWTDILENINEFKAKEYIAEAKTKIYEKFN